MRTSWAISPKPIVVLWVIANFCLFGQLLWHDKSSVRCQTPADHLLPNPDVTQALAIQPREWQIELFIHPECPCTLTTLKLVERLMGELPVRPHLTIYVASYAKSSIDWSTSTNSKLAFRLEQFTVLEDKEATRAKSKGALASGTLVVTDDLGKQLFVGGITTSRSCDDLNPSYLSVRDLLITHQHLVANTNVYGCPL